MFQTRLTVTAHLVRAVANQHSQQERLIDLFRLTINNEIYFYRDTITNQTYPSFYIANAEGGNGYAIVSANLYTTPIIAYSESGNLSLSDTLQYQELSFFFDLVQNYISNNKKYVILLSSSA